MMTSKPGQKQIKANLRNLNINKLDLPWSSIFSFTIRSIWLARNEFLFQNPQNTKTFNPFNIANTALGKSVEFWSANPHPLFKLLLSSILVPILLSPTTKIPLQDYFGSHPLKIGTN